MEIENIVVYAIFIAVFASLIICQSAGSLPYGQDAMRTLVIGGICAYLFNNVPLF
ncbi:hypothetical protein [Methanolobus halotolerans]|uniref:hypothetical protein n=1 Tax=Methanolobus halotolerans TaxID=2052935 RepID=UPI001436985E|nr:hypothetical protein [Methanolobus halotolerans]